MALKINKTVTITYWNMDKMDDVIKKEKTYENAYAMIVHVTGKDNLKMTVATYSDDTKAEVLASKSFTFPANMEGPNFIKQGYEYLKTLPEFTGAVDC